MNKDIRAGLIWGGGLIGLALAVTLARSLGYLDEDTVLRIIFGATGLMVAYYGNLAPKKVAPSAGARQAARVAGWAQVLSGLVYAGLWAFAPIATATTVGTGAVAAGVLVTLGYCLWLRAKARTA